MRRTLTIGCISETLSGSYNGVVIDAIAAEAARLKISLIVYQGWPYELAAMGLAQSQIDGWICLPPSTGLAELHRLNRPIVLVSEPAPDGIHCSSVLSDNRGGIFAAVEHLVSHGQQHIAFAGFFDVADFRERYETYLTALAAHGLPHDSRLVIQTGGYDRAYAKQAILDFLNGGGTCDAIVAVDDDHAIGLLQGIRAFGLRVPDDVAIIGFDDIDDAQHADPPLTTVHQRFDEMGRIAIRMLASEIRGESDPGQLVMAPTTFITRRSCGCRQTEWQDQIAAAYDGPDWHERLADDLARQALFPQQLSPAQSAASIWPGASILVDGLAATLEDSTPPSARAREWAWSEADRLTHRVLSLHGIIRLLREAGIQRSNHDLMMLARLTKYIDLIYGEMLLRYQTRTVSQANFQETQSQTNQDITLAVLNHQPGDYWDLGWMAQAGIRWGCLALWNDSADPAVLMVAGDYAPTREAPSDVRQYAAAMFPPDEALALTTDSQTPSGIKILPIRIRDRIRGFLTLVGSFVHSTRDSTAMWATLLAAALERDEMAASLEAQRQATQTAYEQTKYLADMVHDLGCPVLTLRRGLLLIPLIGAIESRRAQQIAESVLSNVARYRAETVLFDITGVPIVDTQVAATLISLARSVRLLGANTALIGIRPEIAQSIVSLGVGLSDFVYYPSLEAAIAATEAARLNRSRAAKTF